MPWKVFKNGNQFCVHKLTPEGDMGERVACHDSEGQAESQLRALYASESKAATASESFSIFKQADGRYRWIAFSSSSYRDRDGEIVSQKALEDDTARMNAAGDFGTLDWWHTPLRLGRCDFSEMHGRISVEAGMFDDAQIGEAMAAKAADLALSRSFFHPATEPVDGVYHHIKTFSRAILPRGKESNLLTRLFVAQEDSMLKEKIKALADLLGGGKEAEDKVQSILAAAEKEEQRADAEGIAHKESEPAAEGTAAVPPTAETKQDGEGAPAPEGEQPAAEDPMMAKIVEVVKPMAEQMQSMMARMDAMEAQMGEMHGGAAKETDAQKSAQQKIAADFAQIAQTLKESGAQLAGLDKRLKALEGDQPRASAAKQRASRSDETLVKDQDKLKENQPKVDPLAQVIDQFILGNTPNIPTG